MRPLEVTSHVDQPLTVRESVSTFCQRAIRQGRTACSKMVTLSGSDGVAVGVKPAQEIGASAHLRARLDQVAARSRLAPGQVSDRIAVDH